MKRFVAVVQVAAALCAIAFVVLLFANEPEDETASAALTSTPSGQGVDGAAVYANRCASCHGAGGGGGLGPQLSGGRAAQRFPNIADQIRVISDGRGGMPAFGGRLTDAEIEAVAEFVRTQ